MASGSAAVYTSTVLFAAGTAAYLTYITLVKQPRDSGELQLQYTPRGPLHYPIIGHLPVLLKTQDREGEAFYELGRKYGGIFHLDVLGQRVIIVNDPKIATELLERRGFIYCSRPDTILSDTAGLNQFLPLIPYNSDFRAQRRLFTRHFQNDLTEPHHSMQLRAAYALTKNLKASPEDYGKHILEYATALTIELASGHQIQPSGAESPYLRAASDVREFVLPVLASSNRIVDGLARKFPTFLKHMPEWFPGSSYVRRCPEVVPYMTKLQDCLAEGVLNQLKEGIENISFLATHLAELRSGQAQDKSLTKEHIKGAAATIYQAGTGTIHAALLTLIAAMITHQDCLQKVQDEIDRVVGSHRWPTFEDRSKLPYLERCIQEVYRWSPIVPTMQHVSIADDVFDGVYIPKGTVVIGNARGMSWDEKIYDDPFVFNPDRYLTTPEHLGEPYFDAAFGWGRRVCPGKKFGEDSVWIAAACMLATLNIERPLDAGGREYCSEIKFGFDGISSRPQPFECRIGPRKRGY